ncbi:hypothetical protein BVC80_1533g7 [Macleaya cordata]|uniref:Zinc finger protein n=1 Tax=Macleaya cordata TaxID=56857 RepID=A0A200R9I3_MACCD|nr:hypothetical protein BVC80_1533g7 [Macleaya cordata]
MKHMKKKNIGFQEFDEKNSSFSKSKHDEERFENKKSDEVQCYKCRRFGHVANIFPNKKSFGDSKGKKAMNVTFDDSSTDFDSSHDSEEATTRNCRHQILPPNAKTTRM